MTVRLRMQRLGKPNRPYYRIVAIDRRSKRDGKPLEILGQYDPIKGKESVVLKMERIQYWLKEGAEPSRTVASLMRPK